MRPPLAELLRLVVILDADALGGRDPAALARAAMSGGATMLQVRGKKLSAAALGELTRTVQGARAPSVPIIVNDRLDVALAAGAEGCHLGQDDLPLVEARAQAPPGFLLGGSAGTESEARAARAGGADFLGIGPVRDTGNKADAGAPIGVDGFRRILLAGELPAVAIGGVSATDVPALMQAGASGVAVIGAVAFARDAEAAARELREAVDSSR